MSHNSEVYSEPCQTYKMEIFGKIVNGFQLLTIFSPSSILYVRLGSKYAFAIKMEASTYMAFHKQKRSPKLLGLISQNEKATQTFRAYISK